jgi:hypothetical protein
MTEDEMEGTCTTHEEINECKYLIENTEEKRQLECLCVNVRITLKLTLEKYGCKEEKTENFLIILRDYQLFEKGSATLSVRQSVSQSIF